MTGDEDRHGGWQLGADDRYDIRDDERGRACETLLSMCCSAASPAALVKAICCDPLVGKVGEESIVAVDMIVKPVDENELGFRGAVRLGDCCQRGALEQRGSLRAMSWYRGTVLRFYGFLRLRLAS